MPNRDGTGPQGEGPKTGRGLGNCKLTETKVDMLIEWIKEHSSELPALNSEVFNIEEEKNSSSSNGNLKKVIDEYVK